MKIVEPVLEWHDGCRVAAEKAPGEGIDLVDPELAHYLFLIRDP